MTYQEISNRLLLVGFNLGRPARTVDDSDQHITALFIDPVGWFIAVSDTDELNLGRRRAEGLRLLDAQSIPFGKVTPKVISDKVDSALIESLGSVILSRPNPIKDFGTGSAESRPSSSGFQCDSRRPFK